MSSTDREHAILDALDDALSAVLGLQRAASVADLFGDGNPARYLRQPDLRMASHFDLSPAFLILDRELSSLGIVELALPRPGAREEDVTALVQRHIDTATYARHLLLRDRDLKGRKALTVELVLLSADELDAEREGLDAIGAALRQALRGTDSLFQIGVSVLCYASDAGRFDGRLRRAFPWLLKATREWMASPHAKRRDAGVTAAGDGRLERLRLHNYRLPGTRDIQLADARVHLVHGPNGSGKSSIVEALELVSTGTIERLKRANEERFADVIRNRSSDDAATIELGWRADGTSTLDAPRTVTASGIERQLDEDLDAGSFRLDQPLMDKLVGQFPHERAGNFLRAFFPETRESVREYARLAEVRTAALPGVQRILEALDRASAALADLQAWRSTTAPAAATHLSFPRLLNRWLEKTALLDLIRRSRTVRETIRTAREAAWSSDDPAINALLADLAPARDDAALVGVETDIETDAEALQTQLAAFTPAPSPGAPGAAAAIHVDQAKAAALNEVSRWLFDEDAIKSFGLFGDKLARVINAGDAPTYGAIIIGGDGWSVPVTNQIDALIGACKAVVGGQDPPAWPGRSASPDYDQAAKAQAAYNAAGAALSVMLNEKLGPGPGQSGEFDASLIAAVNELMALFTPARWGYNDINLPRRVADGKLGLNIELGSFETPVRAELHLNTAELNLFTVALFLLCTGRVHKPLKLLVFDDPLQNMDELTSTALARGLGKVVRLWAALGRREELLVLFHGYDDLERFHAELPAATYLLPWLSPGSSPATIAIKATCDKPDPAEVQSIKDLLAPRRPHV